MSATTRRAERADRTTTAPWREAIEENEACQAVVQEVRALLVQGGVHNVALKLCDEIAGRIELRRLLAKGRERGAIYAQELVGGLRRLRDVSEEAQVETEEARERLDGALREANALLERVAVIDAARRCADFYSEGGR